MVSRWLALGHRVTVIAGVHPGAARVERPAPNLELHPRREPADRVPACRVAGQARAVKDVDVVLEVVNGITFFTPLWRLRVPRVALVYHVHRDMYVESSWARRGASPRGCWSRCRCATSTPARVPHPLARRADSLAELGVDP